MERKNEWFFGVVVLFLLICHEMLLTTAQREFGGRASGDYPGGDGSGSKKAFGGDYPGGDGSGSKKAFGGDYPGGDGSGSKKAFGGDYPGGEGSGGDGQGKTPEKGIGSTPPDDYSGTPPAPAAGTPPAPAAGTPPTPATGTPPAPAVGGLKSDCLAQSRLFHGMCFSSNNCAGVCVNEGFTGGKCRGFRRRCFCKKAC